jgi:Major Facilitator Superfamily
MSQAQSTSSRAPTPEQAVLGYSALKAGVAFLPLAGTIVAVSTVVSRLVRRTGTRPLLFAGAALMAGGMYWLSRISADAAYPGGLLGHMVVTAAGMGMMFVPLSLTVINRVRPEDSGLASSLLSTCQQAGGAVGLAALGTVAWTTVAASLRYQADQASLAGEPGHPLAGMPVRTAAYHHALADGFSRGFLTAAAIAAGSLVVQVVAIRIRRTDLAGAPAQESP